MQIADTCAASNDQDVVELLQAGQIERAFGLLLPRYELKIYQLCCAMLRDRSQSEDVAQESLVRIWKALHRYDSRSALSTWIYAITRNRCLSALEQRRRTEAHGQDLADPEAQMAALGARSETFHPAGVSSQQRDEQLRTLVDALPERLRRVVVLYYFEERSVDEVARMLGCPKGTVKNQLFRARAALVQLLQRVGLDDPRVWLEGDP